VILPAEPSGRTTDGAFRAELTDLGKRHPVTRGLEGADENPPHWSRWFRLVDSRASKGTTVMHGPDNKPLLLLSHWLMKQPDLEEEALRLLVRGRDLTVQRQTMSDTVSDVTLTTPSGKTR